MTAKLATKSSIYHQLYLYVSFVIGGSDSCRDRISESKMIPCNHAHKEITDLYTGLVEHLIMGQA